MSVCVCVHAHWTNTVKPSPTLFEYQSWVFPLPVSESCLLILGGGGTGSGFFFPWRRSGRRAGSAASQTPLIGPLHAAQNRPAPCSEVFCERIWSGGPHRDVMFQVYSLRRRRGRAHEMRWILFLISRSLPHENHEFFLFNISFHIPVVSDRALLPSDLLLMTVALVIHTDTRPGQNRTETHFQPELEIHKFLTYLQMKFNSGRRVESFELLEKAPPAAAWSVSIPEASSRVWDESSTSQALQTFESTFKHKHSGQVLL